MRSLPDIVSGLALALYPVTYSHFHVAISSLERQNFVYCQRVDFPNVTAVLSYVRFSCLCSSSLLHPKVM